MPETISQTDPIRAYARNASARRRLGIDARCRCGEERPEALSREKGLVFCGAC